MLEIDKIKNRKPAKIKEINKDLNYLLSVKSYSIAECINVRGSFHRYWKRRKKK